MQPFLVPPGQIIITVTDFSCGEEVFKRAAKSLKSFRFISLTFSLFGGGGGRYMSHPVGPAGPYYTLFNEAMISINCFQSRRVF
jgi:hypothetical protein